MIFNVAGGGSIKPNLRVILCTIQPESPSENTFWVKIGSETLEEYADYVFSSNEPLDPHDGLLWFKTSSSSCYAFSPVKDAEIYVYPAVCYQYMSDDTKWVKVPVNIYMHNEWHDMDYSYLYSLGDECKHITGGWGTISIPYSGDTGTAPIIDRTDGNMSATIGTTGTLLKTKDKIDLTNYSKIVFIGSYTESATTANAWYGAWSKMGGTYQENICAVTKITVNNSDNVVVDISELTGEYFVGVGFRSSKVTIKECYLIV